ncbi:hybrid sensor histidine kinase/response regulator [Aquincola tertiaricarbonis]|uniref:hybrid sensor histidine kinase/response regulator n=1 Tax=Aquincola tertiaricarbonis TaxID=391953 RepID=UPI0018DBDE5B|nr:PAS domain-containing sensor histidine kinase [Aquincola tertiaricarbonis]
MDPATEHPGDDYAAFLGRSAPGACLPATSARLPAPGAVVYEIDPAAPDRPRFGGDLAAWLGGPVPPASAGPWPWAGRVHPEDAGRSEAARRAALALRQPLHQAWRLLGGDGHPREVEEHAHWLGADGDAPRLLGLLRDVTPQRAEQAALQRDGERLSLALAAGQLGTWDWSIHTEDLEWSATARQMFGLAPEAPVDFARFIGLLHEEDAPRVQQAIATALATGEDYRVDFRVRWPDGTLHWLQARGRPQRDGSGQSMRMTGVVQDITAQRQREAEHAAHEAQLLQAQKMQAVGTFAAGIAHDFSNLVAAMQGHLSLAREQLPAGSPAAAGLEQAALAARRARALTQDILAFSRDEPAPLAPLLLGPLVEETARLVRASLPAGTTLAVHACGQPVCVRGNRSQLQRVLMNLCTNAWQALPATGGLITLRLDSEAASGCALLSVADNGVGMSPQVQQRLFEPFFTTRGAAGGTGLGLSVVHGIVGAHGGRIEVDSTPGQGTCFTLRLPLCEEAVPAAPAAATPPPAAEPAAGPLVVYVDDDEVLLMLMGRLLARAGCRPHCVSSPAEALQLAGDAAAAIDLLITDLDMPAMSGMALAEALQRTRPGLPVVICSGSVDAALLQQARRAGVAEVVAKAQLLDDLRGSLGALLPAAAAASGVPPQVPQ